MLVYMDKMVKILWEAQNHVTDGLCDADCGWFCLFNLKTNKKNMWLTVLKFYTKYNDKIGIPFNSEVIRNINPTEKAVS